MAFGLGFNFKGFSMPLQNPFYLKYFPNKIQQRLEGRHNLFAVLHNSGWLIADKVFKAVVTIVVGAWVARYLGPAEYGKLAYILAIVAFFQVISNLGLDGIVVREIAKKKDEAGVILGTTFMMRMIVGILCWMGLVVFMLAIYGWGNENVWLALLVGGSLIFQAADTIDLWFQSQTQSRRTVLAKFIAVLISSLLRVAFITFKAPLIYFAMAFSIEWGIAALALLISYQKFKCGQTWMIRLTDTGVILLSQSWYFIVALFSYMIYTKIDQLMIKNILGGKELGIYSAATVISTGFYIIPMTLQNSLLPIMTRLRKNDEQLFLKQLTRIFRILALTSIVICLLTVWQSENLVQFVYGVKYIRGSGILAIHVFTIIPIFMSAGQNLWIFIEGKSKLFLLQCIIGGIVSLILNSFLIQKFGIVGAATSAIIVQFIATVFSNYFLDRDLFYLQFGIKKINISSQ